MMKGEWEEEPSRRTPTLGQPCGMMLLGITYIPKLGSTHKLPGFVAGQAFASRQGLTSQSRELSTRLLLALGSLRIRFST